MTVSFLYKNVQENSNMIRVNALVRVTVSANLQKI